MNAKLAERLDARPQTVRLAKSTAVQSGAKHSSEMLLVVAMIIAAATGLYFAHILIRTEFMPVEPASEGMCSLVGLTAGAMFGLLIAGFYTVVFGGILDD